MIKLTNIEKTFIDGKEEHKILKGIDLSIADNEFITIMGASGSGKSTLLNIIALLLRPSAGEVFLDDVKVNFKKEKELERLRSDKIGLVFQNANLISCLNPLENILLAMNSDKSYRGKKNEVLELMEIVGVADKYKCNINTLSGGEAQRVSIVRALVNKPSVLLCDEPTGALDKENSEIVLRLLRKTQEVSKCSLVIVTHDTSIGELGERKVVLNGGRNVGVGESI